jgi:F420-non-reducing hydrogenase small subunit
MKPPNSRQKSVVFCAFGVRIGRMYSGNANLYDKESIIDYVYRKSPSVDNPNGVIPLIEYKVPEGILTIPEMWNTVRTLGQTVDVDYIIPGCPPQSNQISEVVAAVIDILGHGKPLPPKGTVLGASEKSCCDECKRDRNVKKIKNFIRPFEKVTDPNLCLLEQGIVCMGPATRAGCGAKCVNAGVPCRGCYGLPANIRDQGAKMASALASVIDSTDSEEIDKIIATIPDPVGTFYRFSLPDSLLRRAQR